MKLVVISITNNSSFCFVADQERRVRNMLSIVAGKLSDTVEQTESPPKETGKPTPVVAKARYDSKCLFITMLYKVVLTF